jgi:predicted RNA-binding protein
MCEASAFLLTGDREELLLEAVDLIEPDGADTYRIVSIFGEQKVIKGRIKSIKLVDHKIVFEP